MSSSQMNGPNCFHSQNNTNNLLFCRPHNHMTCELWFSPFITSTFWRLFKSLSYINPRNIQNASHHSHSFTFLQDNVYQRMVWDSACVHSCANPLIKRADGLRSIITSKEHSSYRPCEIPLYNRHDLHKTCFPWVSLDLFSITEFLWSNRHDDQRNSGWLRFLPFWGTSWAFSSCKSPKRHGMHWTISRIPAQMLNNRGKM